MCKWSRYTSPYVYVIFCQKLGKFKTSRCRRIIVSRDPRDRIFFVHSITSIFFVTFKKMLTSSRYGLLNDIFSSGYHLLAKHMFTMTSTHEVCPEFASFTRKNTVLYLYGSVRWTWHTGIVSDILYYFLKDNFMTKNMPPGTSEKSYIGWSYFFQCNQKFDTKTAKFQFRPYLDHIKKNHNFSLDVRLFRLARRHELRHEVIFQEKCIWYVFCTPSLSYRPIYQRYFFSTMRPVQDI